MLIILAAGALGFLVILACVVLLFMSRMTSAERWAVVLLITILVTSSAVILSRSQTIQP